MTREGDREALRTLVEFACPFCKGRASAAETVEDAHATVLHTLPPCERWLALDPVEYMGAVNDAIERRRVS